MQLAADLAPAESVRRDPLKNGALGPLITKAPAKAYIFDDDGPCTLLA